MQPTVEINMAQNGRFTCAVGIGNGMHCYIRDGLGSIAACVKDAASALGHEFKFATIAYNRTPVGSFSVATMAHRSVLVADELAVKASQATDA